MSLAQVCHGFKIDQFRAVVSALCKKFKKAQSGETSARSDHEDLSQSIQPELMDMWEDQEAEALQARRADIQAMDIYEVSMERGRRIFPALSGIPSEFIPTEAPSRAANQLALAADEQSRGVLRGCATWLGDGLRIEESQ